MCGIVGWKEWNSSIKNLQYLNSKRGGYSTGVFNFENNYSFSNEGTFFPTDTNNSIVQYRAPTAGINNFIKQENYPLKYKNWNLFGNGVINADFFKQIKDEDNNNDLYYILKGIVNNGFKWLEKVEGTFALVIIDDNHNIYLIRKDFPLFFNKNQFSSIQFDNSEKLKSGILYDWTYNKHVKELNFKEEYLHL